MSSSDPLPHPHPPSALTADQIYADKDFTSYCEWGGGGRLCRKGYANVLAVEGGGSFKNSQRTLVGMCMCMFVPASTKARERANMTWSHF